VNRETGHEMSAVHDSRTTVVLVEADRALRDVILLALRRAGFSVVSVDHPEDSVAIIRAAHPFLVLLDLFLPHISGLDILKAMDENLRSRCFVFVLSALGFPETVQQAKKAGAHDFLLKPIDTDALVEKVRQARTEARFLEPWG
jgi:DNA-binding response OmpR family regulator